MLASIILSILLIILCILAIIFLINQNRAYKEKHINAEEKVAAIENHYKYLRNKDVILYHKLYERTLDLLKDCSHRDFFVVFDKYFKEENLELYEEFKNHNENVPPPRWIQIKPHNGLMLAAYKRFFMNYINFKGRANRAEYWWAGFCWWIIFFLVVIVTIAISGNSSMMGFTTKLKQIYSTATLIPFISLVVRRLHDINKTGWLSLLLLLDLVLMPIVPILVSKVLNIHSELYGVAITLIPILIFILFLILIGLPRGTKGPNKYGDPSDF